MASTHSNTRIHVAVGVIVNEAKKILIALRPKQSHQGGLWEFPGGKVEDGETVEVALSRELNEELGLIVSSSRPLLTIHHEYTDKCVVLDVCWVEKFVGVANGREGQPIRWVNAEELSEYRFPAANHDIVIAIQKEILID
ncbi:MAG: 8-oxo-dGTP diphosphatase [Oceanicoccus sp.]|jgi:8-oxo-dGTP diphosphatase